MPALLAEVRIESGVSAFTGEPFCSIHALDDHGEILASGQLTPLDVRAMALAWLEAAEAAITDAAFWALLRERFEVDEKTAALVLSDLRARRVDS